MKTRILVVDNDRALQNLLCELLEDEGYEVDVADDGLKAWEKLMIQKKAYNLLLLDGVMPHMGGLELLQVLRWQKEIITPPVVVLSASDDILQQANHMKVDFMLAKPFDVEKLLVLITHILHQQAIESFQVAPLLLTGCSREPGLRNEHAQSLVYGTGDERRASICEQREPASRKRGIAHAR